MAPPDPLPATGRPRPRAWVIATLYVLLCVIWGSTWLVIKEGLDDLPQFWSASVRMALAGAVMVLIAPPFSRFEGGRTPPAGLWIVVGVVHLAGSFGIVYLCEHHLSSGLVAVLWSVFPMMVALLGTLFVPGERVHWTQGIGFAVAFGGVAILFAFDLPALSDEAVLYGAILLLSPLLSAISTLTVKRFGGGYSSALMNRNAMLLAGVLLAIVALARGETFPREWTGKGVFSVIYLALLGSVFAFGAYFWLIRHIPAYRMSLIAYVTPAIALLLGNWRRSEPVKLTTILGAAVVLSGVVLASRKPGPRPAR